MVKHLVATAKKSNSHISQIYVDLREKETTAYFVGLNIYLFSRKSIITAFHQNAPFKAQIWVESRNFPSQNEKIRTDEEYQMLKKQHQNIFWQLFEYFMIVYLHHLIEFIQPTSG